MTGSLRAGVVGLGYAGRTHAAAYQRLGVDVVAVADLSSVIREQVGTELGVPAVETLEQVLGFEPDLLSVCLPNALHPPATLAALAAGCHVLCEKPMACTTTAAQSMVDGAEAADRVLHVAFNHRYRGDVEVLRRHVSSGALGRIYHAKASWMRRQGIPGRGSWFTSHAIAGGGPLIDLGVHVLDMALHLLGEPAVTSVTAATYGELGHRGRGYRRGTGAVVEAGYDVEDLGTAFLRLEGGATLLLEAAWASYGAAHDAFGVTLFGTDGGAEIAVRNYARSETLEIFTDIGDVPAVVRPDVGPGEGHVGVVRDFIDAVTSGDWGAHRGREGLARTRVLDACYASAETGREVTMPPG
jgi:predicted dehydrogenase